MKKIAVAVIFAVLMCAVVPGAARADLSSFLQRLNTRAKSDIERFTAEVGQQFNVPLQQVKDIIKKTASPADAFMVLQLGQMSNTAPDAVVNIYQRNRSKGWGAIAHELGIKPGSPEFHALKRGDFALTGRPSGGGAGAADGGPGRGHGRGHGKGHGRWK